MKRRLPMRSRMKPAVLFVGALGAWAALMLVRGRVHRAKGQSASTRSVHWRPTDEDTGGIFQRAGRTSDGSSGATTGHVDRATSLDLTEVALASCLEGRRIVHFALPDEHTAKVEKWWAGGFGDRLLGMVTALYLAVLTDSGFTVEWKWPYDVHEFFDIRECNASSSTPSAASKPRASSSQAVVSENAEALAGNSTVRRNTLAQDLWSYFSDGTFVEDDGKDLVLWSNARHWQELVRHPSTRPRAQALGMHELSRKELFKLGVESLFRRPSRLLADSHARLMRQFSHALRPTPLVGVQIRTGGDGDGWSDPPRHPVPSASSCFAAEAATLCLTQGACSVFLTSDSKKAASLFVERYTKLVEGYMEQRRKKTTTTKTWARGREMMRQPRAIVVQTPGIIAHTDRSTLLEDGNAVSQAWVKSVLDWWTLKNADYLLISRSGFGETAAWASNAKSVRRLQLPQASAAEAGASVDGDESNRSNASDAVKNFDDVVGCSFDGAEDAFL